MNTNQPLIEADQVRFSYADGFEALRGISLRLDPGEFVAIVGANGSGKTTLIRHFNALLQPERGHLHVGGLYTSARENWPAIRAQVALVFQRPEDQIVATTVEDDVAFGPENLGLDGEEIERRVRWALESVDAWELRQRPPHLLSAGQQQRVAIAGALAIKPRCLVLDEASAMLDPVGRRELLALLHRLHADGMTIVMVTHSMSEAAQAKRAIALAGGEIVFDGPPRALLTNPDQLAAAGLEAPPLAQLSARLAERWPDFPPDLLTSDELAAALAPRLTRARPPAGPPPIPAPPGLPILSANDLYVTYLAGSPLAAPALAGLSLDVHNGGAQSLLGRTGSGKSTLLQSMAGVLRPDAGQVLLEGQDVYGRRADKRLLRQSVGLLLQRPEDQLFETFVGDDVAFGPRQLGLNEMTIDERVQRAMERAGISYRNYQGRAVQSLSEGERRKVALAGVLALQPRVLLLDEPVAGMDPRARRDVLAALRRLHHEHGVALLVATHAMEDAAFLTDRAVIVSGGRVASAGAPRQLFGDSGMLATFGLDVPEVTALMARLHAPTPVLDVDEAVAFCLAAG